MPFASDGRPPLALVSTAALTVYDAVAVAIWALVLFLVTRGSRGSLTRDLFVVVLAAALTGS